MKRMLLSITIMALLIGIGNSAIGIYEYKSVVPEEIDISQYHRDHYINFDGSHPAFMQSFKPNHRILTSVYLYLRKNGNSPYSEYTLYLIDHYWWYEFGNVISHVTVNANDIPQGDEIYYDLLEAGTINRSRVKTVM